jgi:hypothetical protein
MTRLAKCIALGARLRIPDSKDRDSSPDASACGASPPKRPTSRRFAVVPARASHAAAVALPAGPAGVGPFHRALEKSRWGGFDRLAGWYSDRRLNSPTSRNCRKCPASAGQGSCSQSPTSYTALLIAAPRVTLIARMCFARARGHGFASVCALRDPCLRRLLPGGPRGLGVHVREREQPYLRHEHNGARILLGTRIGRPAG